MNPLLTDEWQYVKKVLDRFKKKRLSFISIHYIFIISMAIIGSILLYPAGGMPYIDAIFFASGAATQSGLNTIDVNILVTYQQIVLYIIPMLTNPIVIHTSVVFVRLYWFEKRFQRVVKDAMAWRRSKSKGRPDTREGQEKDAEIGQKRVNVGDIRVLDDGKPVGPGMNRVAVKNAYMSSPIIEDSNSDSNSQSAANGNSEPIRREVTWADTIDSPFSPPARLPHERSTEQHIAFLENQRNPKDKGILRIPGPRESDQGYNPETIGEDESMARQISRSATQPAHSFDLGDELKREDRSRRNITFDSHTRAVLSPIESQRSTVHFESAATDGSRISGEGYNTYARPGTPGTSRPRRLSNTISNFMRSDTKPNTPAPYLSWQPTVGRNSAFIDLTEEQREELGGIEYRSLKTLAVILIAYWFFWHSVGIIVLAAWIMRTPTFGSIVTGYGVGRPWWAVFSGATLFNDLGFTLTPDSFISFQSAVVPLLLGTFLIIFGNTGFPCLLRFKIWILSKIVPENGAYWEEIKFLLDHPRRCFTLLFPSNATWVLFAILILLNGIDLVFFIILDLNDEAVTSIPPGYRILAGLFQAASTRTAGTAAVNLANLHPGIQVSYMIMMYISIFPIAISMRRTNVYEEKSLGIYNSTEDNESNQPSYIGYHLRKQLSFDLWFIFLGLFIIAIVEGDRLQDPTQTSFTLFACLFEIVSAYGTVGLSLGYPTNNASFSAQFRVISKLVICAMMIRGRHRGLPYQLDRAVLLPSENLHRKEDFDANMRAGRTPTYQNPNTADGILTYPSVSQRSQRSQRSLQTESYFPRQETPHEPRDVQSAPATATALEHTHSASNEHWPHARRGVGRMMAGVANLNDMMRSHTHQSRHDSEINPVSPSS